MFGRPLPAGARAIVVRPDDLVEETLPPEELIEQDLAVMYLAVVDVKVQAAVFREDALRFDQARLEEEQEVIKDVTIRLGTDLNGGIALTRKTCAVAAVGFLGPELGARLHLAGVERRVDVDQLNARGWQRAQDLQIIAKEYTVHFNLFTICGV